MRKLAAALIFYLVFTCQFAFAHPPTAIEISYDTATQILTAVITHPVQDGSTHYIGKVDIGINGAEVLTQKFSAQENDTAQTLIYKVPGVKPGDVVSVEGYCNINGTKEEKITVE